MPRPPTIDVEMPEPPAWIARHSEAVRAWRTDLAWRCAATEAPDRSARERLLVQVGVILPATPQQYEYLRRIARQGCGEQFYWQEVMRVGADEGIAADIWQGVTGLEP